MVESGEDQHEANPSDESQWAPLAPTDDLWATPPHRAPPLVDTAPALLNTHELEWEDFERLVAAMARYIDGAHDVRRYGRPGQAQHGIDLVGFFAGGAPAVYTAKRQQSFTAGDLQKAVLCYAEGRRPFGAKRVVVAVACEARDTLIIDKLAALQQSHGDLAIELWDRAVISDRLRDEPRIVVTFFGTATALRFCGESANEAAASSGPVSADAILRGPIAYLGMSDDLRRAEEALADEPFKAAQGFAHIAGRLEASPFSGHANRVREQQAAALTAAGRQVEASHIRLRLGWRQLSAGDVFSALGQVRILSEMGAGLPEEVLRSGAALSATAGHLFEHSVGLDDVAAAFDDLRGPDPFRGEAALALAEEAIATRRPDLIAARRAALLSIAGQQPLDDAGQLIRARLHMCLADCNGDWETLAASARTTYSPKVTSWILARHARHLALTGRPELSDHRWLQAIERACEAGLYDDAADWLYALRAVRVQYGFLRDVEDLHRLAVALRLSGSGTVLHEPFSSKEQAFRELLDKKWPDALQALRRFASRSTIAASWADELEAHGRLGDLFLQTGRHIEASRHFVYGGKRKRLEDLAAALPEAPLRWGTDLLGQVPWERAAAFTFVAAAGDLLVDEDARAWAALALRDIASSGGQRVLPFSDDPVLAAFEAFGQLAVVSDERAAREFVKIAAELVAREPNHYRPTDEAHVRALIGIARSLTELRKDAVDQLLGAMLADERMANIALAAEDLLSWRPALVEERCAEAARAGHLGAALALVIAGGDTEAATPLARRRLKAFTDPSEREPGVQHIGTGARSVALLMTVLGDDDRGQFAAAMLGLASDQEEPAINREEALLAIMPVARTLPDTVRDELFDQALVFALEEPADTDSQITPMRSTDPLSRFRFSMGPDSLLPAGLLAAAALARTDRHFEVVQRRGLQMLQNADQTTGNAVARALSYIPPDRMSIDLGLLASQSSPSLRALAAVVWSRDPQADAGVGSMLAKDPARLVRSSLASSLLDIRSHDAARAILSVDPRRSIREKTNPARDL